MLFYDSYLILLVNPCHGRPRHKVASFGTPCARKDLNWCRVLVPQPPAPIFLTRISLLLFCLPWGLCVDRAQYWYFRFENWNHICPSVVISVVVIIVPIFLHHLGIIFLRNTVFGLFLGCSARPAAHDATKEGGRINIPQMRSLRAACKRRWCWSLKLAMGVRAMVRTGVKLWR